MKTNYNITIGFKAVININVDAESVEAAKKIAEETFEREIKKAFQKIRDQLWARSRKFTITFGFYSPGLASLIVRNVASQ